ncbi:Rust resistance kinase Lr10 [Zea mays]|uniref:Rust resistance kinase Lr10 n=1 Tax=Zea mays TaxID=4577 RepID=A0A3L6G6U8_MAIZE|nr:Rust resistance kinase Lr10 [Zea mays]
MVNSCAPAAFLHSSASWQALLVFFISVAAVGAADAGGQDAGGQGPCPHFSCGDLGNISKPFRRPGDPEECGVKAYELVCSNGKATIRINTGTYFVTSINYTNRSFWVVDANLDMHSSCPLPRWDQFPYTSEGLFWRSGKHTHIDLPTDDASLWACFVNCSRAVRITNNLGYKPVTCLSGSSSFVYIYVQYGACTVGSLEPFCGYLAEISFGTNPKGTNASYADIIQVVKKGFSVGFPKDEYDYSYHNTSWIFKTCLNNFTRYFHEQLSSGGIVGITRAFFWSDVFLLKCAESYNATTVILDFDVISVVTGVKITTLLVLFRFVFTALAVQMFLAHKYWKTTIAIDAVEKFLHMQQMLGPTRFAYTDITAITGHFRDKLGQGGYGSVYKGALLSGNMHVAVKMLGNSNCNGDEFISEVSTIGRIHHINVVRLVGFCAEEMRRALVYEYMPNGSLDKYIFSAERSFSWDMLNEIALGIARGINYLHLGCDMQILHFDIKPHNILLDSNFVPKVSDFGLAKLYPRDKSFVPASAMRGTIGYIAPEMISRSFGAISSKSDVYSFGMLLLEMAGGRRNADQNAANSSRAYYPAWVYDRLAEQDAGEISVAADMHELERKLCIVGLRCIQMKPQDRPTMSEVIEMLECGTHGLGLQMPSRPFFCDDDDPNMPAADSYHFSSELTAISEEDG